MTEDGGREEDAEAKPGGALSQSIGGSDGALIRGQGIHASDPCRQRGGQREVCDHKCDPQRSAHPVSPSPGTAQLPAT